ncbi:MAG TPA: hypothetical protein DDY72_02470 [Verrucomicrobia bacterium]|nr:hypothetical protein [Verrucomicrobiota bacterium]
MLRDISLSSWKFFRAGKGLSFRTGQYFGEAALIGVLTGLVVVAFRYMIDYGTRALIGSFIHPRVDGTFPDIRQLAQGFSAVSFGDCSRWVMLFLPAAGALAGYLLIRRFTKLENARGTDSAIRAYHQRGGYVTGTVIPVKSVASVLTVASGGSAGYEGPVTLLGAAVGSVVARKCNLTVRARRILMAAGLAAGIAALFQAPLAGAIFGFEIFYSSSDIEYETVLPCFVAAALSYTIYACFFGWGSLFVLSADNVYETGLVLVPYFVLAIIVTFAARFYISFFRGTEKRFGMSHLPGAVKVVIGGLATGLVGFFIPDILGPGYPLIQSAFRLEPDALAQAPVLRIAFTFFLLFVLKVVATSFTVGSGGSGGVFAPALVCGGAVGAATGLLFSAFLPASFSVQPAAFALVGMAGFVASAIRVPLTAIVIVAEISGNHQLLLPAMWVCGISFWLNNGWSLYRSQVHSRESSPVHA